MTIMEKVLALHEVDIFRQMSSEELSILASIAEEDQFDKGAELFREQEPADSLSLILSGEVRVLRSGNEIFVAGPYETLGALSMLDGDPWLFSAVASAPTRVLRINREAFLDVASDHPGIIEAILSNLTKRIRRLVNAPISTRPPEPQDEA